MASAAACFFGTLVTDVAYWRTANVVWADFSDWLVTAGVIAGYAALVVPSSKYWRGERDASFDRPGLSHSE
jgi:uncharacterized membrane protein